MVKKTKEEVAPGQVELDEVLEVEKPVKPKLEPKVNEKSTKSKYVPNITRINFVRTNDNRIMCDLKTLESFVDNKIIEELISSKSLDPGTLQSVKSTLADIFDTAVLSISEQNHSGVEYKNGTIKELEIDYSKLFN